MVRCLSVVVTTHHLSVLGMPLCSQQQRTQQYEHAEIKSLGEHVCVTKTAMMQAALCELVPDLLIRPLPIHPHNVNNMMQNDVELPTPTLFLSM